MSKSEKAHPEDKYVCSGRHIDIAEEKSNFRSERKFCDKCESFDEDVDCKGELELEYPKVEITAIEVTPSGVCAINAPLRISIYFALDRDVVAAHWEIKVCMFFCCE